MPAKTWSRVSWSRAWPDSYGVVIFVLLKYHYAHVCKPLAGFRASTTYHLYRYPSSERLLAESIIKKEHCHEEYTTGAGISEEPHRVVR